MTDKTPRPTVPAHERPVQTNDRGLPPVQNTLPMPKVVPPKKD